MRRSRRTAAWAAAFLLAAGGCGGRRPGSFYDNGRLGLSFTPPAGWSERVPAHRPGAADAERLLVQYKRLTAGRPAWLRVTTARAPSTTPLPELLARREPGAGWRPEGGCERLEVGGLPAARRAYVGRLRKDGYVDETTAVRKGDRVVFFHAVVPPADDPARAEVRRAVDSARWR